MKNTEMNGAGKKNRNPRLPCDRCQPNEFPLSSMYEVEIKSIEKGMIISRKWYLCKKCYSHLTVFLDTDGGEID